MVNIIPAVRRYWLPILVLAALLPAAPAQAAVTARAGPYRIELRTQPAVVPVGAAHIQVTVTASGRPVTSADVHVLAQMPTMPMGERAEAAAAVAGSPGVYRAPARFGMAGKFVATVTVRGPQGEGHAALPISTGQDTSVPSATASARFPGRAVGLALVLVVAAALWLMGRRRNRLKDRPPLKAGAWIPVLVGALLLAAAGIGAVVMVRKMHQPSQMTVLQSQAMDMAAMQAPPGAAPVVLSTVRKGRIQARVTYTGSVVPREEQDVAARVDGYLRELKAYPGDRVHRGEVVAVVVARELDTRVEEAGAGVQAAESDVTVAFHGVHHASAMQAQAQADVQAARASQTSARADLAYQQADYRREGALYRQDAISLDEYQLSQSEYRMAQAKVLETGEKVRAAASYASVVDAHRGSAQAELKASRARAGQAAAQLATARTLQGFQVVRSDLNGVVTQRLVALGSLVSPASVIFKIAAIDPIRIQAAVAQPDLAGIQVGSHVSIWSQKRPGRAVRSRVTSVFPASDPSTRTAVVEALTPNPHEWFLPGDYVTMSIERGIGGRDPWVPVSAVVPPDARGRRSVWVARGRGKALRAARVFVTVGFSDGARTEIRSGLHAGDRVIARGWHYLHDGDRVVPTRWGSEGPLTLPPAPSLESMPAMPGMDMRGR